MLEKIQIVLIVVAVFSWFLSLYYYMVARKHRKIGDKILKGIRDRRRDACKY